MVYRCECNPEGDSRWPQTLPAAIPSCQRLPREQKPILRRYVFKTLAKPDLNPCGGKARSLIQRSRNGVPCSARDVPILREFPADESADCNEPRRETSTCSAPSLPVLSPAWIVGSIVVLVMADRFLETTLAVKEMMPKALERPAGRG